MERRTGAAQVLINWKTTKKIRANLRERERERERGGEEEEEEEEEDGVSERSVKRRGI